MPKAFDHFVCKQLQHSYISQYCSWLFAGLQSNMTHIPDDPWFEYLSQLIQFSSTSVQLLKYRVDYIKWKQVKHWWFLSGIGHFHSSTEEHVATITSIVWRAKAIHPPSYIFWEVEFPVHGNMGPREGAQCKIKLIRWDAKLIHPPSYIVGPQFDWGMSQNISLCCKVKKRKKRRRVKIFTNQPSLMKKRI